MKMKIELDNHTNDLKDIIFDILSNENIKSFTVSFDGSGDSGQIEDISSEVPDKVLQKEVQGVRIANGVRYSQGGSETIWEEAKTVEDVIQSVCYSVLGHVCGGWEINDGSYGEFTFNVKNRKVSLDFNERITDVKSSEYTF